MPLKKGSAHFPTTQREWDQWAREVAVTPDPNSVGTSELKDKEVTFAKIEDLPASSVFGNPQSSQQSGAAITAASDNQLLVRRAGLLAFGVLIDSDIPDTLARDDEVANDITASITALKSETDPFPIYLRQAEGDALYVQLTNVLTGSKTYDPPSLGTGTQTSTTVTVTGVALGDFVLASFSLDLQGISVHAYVSAADTVTVILLNMTGGTLDLAPGTLKVRGWKQ